MNAFAPGFWALLLSFWSLGSLWAPTSYAVTIVHSNDVLGEIEPCGCRTNPLGGYARKANVLKSLKDFKGGQIIQLDAGDLLFPSDKMPEVLRKQSVVQAQWIMRILGLLHMDAVTPGEKDFSLGAKTFLRLVDESRTPFIAANLYEQGGKPLLSPSLILTRRHPDGKPIRVAILGLVGTDVGWPKSLYATDPIEAAKKYVPSLRKKADLVIALTHEGLEEDKKLAREVPGIDIIIGGHSQSFIQEPAIQKTGKTMIYQSSFRNQYVGVLDLETFPSEDSYRLIGLDAGYDSPPGKPGAVDVAVGDFKRAIARFNMATDVPESPSQASRFQTFPRCAECHLKQFEFWRKTPHAMALAPLVKAGQDKNKECLSCHTVGLGAKGGFNNVNHIVLMRDGRALPTERFVDYLSSLHEGKDLSSPARGLSSETGIQSMTINQSLGQLKRAWTPVQCENCHGPGGDHPMAGVYTKTVRLQVCMSCHTPDRAPAWYLRDGSPDWKKIEAKHALMSCPSGDLSD